VPAPAGALTLLCGARALDVLGLLVACMGPRGAHSVVPGVRLFAACVLGVVRVCPTSAAPPQGVAWRVRTPGQEWAAAGPPAAHSCPCRDGRVAAFAAQRQMKVPHGHARQITARCKDTACAPRAPCPHPRSLAPWRQSLCRHTRPQSTTANAAPARSPAVPRTHLLAASPPVLLPGSPAGPP
jgi:hypothetical protein